MSLETGKKKLSGHQNLINKRKREENLERNYGKITQFFGNTHQEEPSTSSSSTFMATNNAQMDTSQSQRSTSNIIVPENAIFNEDTSILVPASESAGDIEVGNVQTQSFVIPDDPGLWPDNLTPFQIETLVESGPSRYQNECDDYPRDTSERKFSSVHFTRILPNFEKIKRQWLLYSKSKNAVFCFCCKLFSSSLKVTRFGDTTGFNDWKHIGERLNIHESSKSHFENLKKWCDLDNRLKSNTTIDSTRRSLLNSETKYWSAVIERIFYTIQFLSEQNLAFRGTNNKLFEKNNGNFLKCIEMISKFDQVMAEHTKKVQRNPNDHKNMPHYLGEKIQNEIINLIGTNLRAEILNRVKKCKYFSIILDCTPDVSHQEQISVCIRFVNLNFEYLTDTECCVEEHFLTFCPTTDTTGKGLSTFLLSTLEQYGLNIDDLRGQGYDNGANMRGKHNGVQKKILDINSRAFFVPCCNHTLNLVVNDASKCNISCVIFFSTIQEIYNFFSASTNRWSILKKYVLNLTVKPLSDTRWSSRIDAVTPLRYQLGEIYDSLFEIASDSNNLFDNNAKNVATTLGNKIKNFEFICLLTLWYNILSKVHIASKILQTKDFDISHACSSLNVLIDFLKKYRSDKGFSDLLVDAKEVASSLAVEAKFESKEALRPRIRKTKKQFAYEHDDEVIENRELRFKVDCFFAVLDLSIQSIQERFTLLMQFSHNFNFLSNLSKFLQHSEEEQLKFCINLESVLTDKNKNKRDINGKELLYELRFLLNFELKSEIISSPIETLNYIIKNKLNDGFPNITIALRILLTMPISVATAERSFSKLKIIKNYLRSTMSQERLENLAIISIESDLLNNLDTQEMIKQFAKNKARKANIL